MMTRRIRKATGRRNFRILSPFGFASSSLMLLGALACQSQGGPAASAEGASSPHKHEKETHFGSLRQLTDGGENAEAYWSFAGDRFTFQAHEGQGCDQIYTMPTNVGAAGEGAVSGGLPERQLVSTGKGATTCAYFLPGDKEIVYSSTHLGGDACPPPPDRSKGYVWPLYDTYDIFRANADGSGLRRLTSEPGYDAEATVCPVDGSLIFTSVRDGDLELYRMDADGSNVKRLTHTPGYDGGAFFSEDCTKIVWRASRPTGEKLKEYQQLLSEDLVKPGELELFVANADGSEARQVTNLKAAAFGPFFAPGAKRILFSTNAFDKGGNPRAPEFDIWAVDIDGTNYEQITHTPGFDGFPMFSHDGKYLAFSSNRASPDDKKYETNVFIAEWIDHEPPTPEEPTAADRVMKDVEWLADPARQGRGVGTDGLEASGAYIEEQFQSIGLSPLVPGGSFRHELEVTTAVVSGPETSVSLNTSPLSASEAQPLGFSASGTASGAMVLAGYGIEDDELGQHDYAKLDVRGKIAVVRRFVPDSAKFADPKTKRRFGNLRQKAWQARNQGATALIVVDAPERPTKADKQWQAPAEAQFPALERTSYGDAGIPAVIVQREAFADTLARLEKGQSVQAAVGVQLTLEKKPVFNVLAKWSAPDEGKLPGAILIGAHYDHLGFGGTSSLAPGDNSPHLGADDNASGVALILEVARRLTKGQPPRRDVIFAAFTAEEMGILGSSHLVKNPPQGLTPDQLYAMFNFDMVGRLSESKLSILGGESAEEWSQWVPEACAQVGVECHLSGSGYGPSDHSAFYAAGVPVLHFFTGAHSDYHKPSDTANLVNATGVSRVAELTSLLLHSETAPQKLSYRKLPPEQPGGDSRSFNASLGSIPDYAGPPDGRKGVLLSGVRPGSGAQLAGMQRGDILVRLGDKTIDSVHDLMFALNSAKPNQTVGAVVEREGKPVNLKVTFQERNLGKVAGSAHGKPQGAHGANHGTASGAHAQ